MKYWTVAGILIVTLAILAVGETRAVFSTEATISGNSVSTGTWNERDKKCREHDEKKDKEDLHLTSGRQHDNVHWKLEGCDLNKYKHYKYKITYRAKEDDEDLEKGMQGEGVINNDYEVGAADLFLGSCSSNGKCSPDKYHGDLEIEVELTGDENKTLRDKLKLTTD